MAGISNKCQITAVLCGTMAGDFLPPQLIYQGKTTACLPRYNHWSNEEKMIEYITIPYVRRTLTITSSLSTF